MAVVAVHMHCRLTSLLCRPPFGLSESLIVPIRVEQDNFSLLFKGLEEGVLHVQWRIPLKTGMAVTNMGLSKSTVLLEYAGMGSERRSVHKSVLALIHIVDPGVAGRQMLHVFSAHIWRHKSVS
jgi:hypothetical protein